MIYLKPSVKNGKLYLRVPTYLTPNLAPLACQIRTMNLNELFLEVVVVIAPDSPLSEHAPYPGIGEIVEMDLENDNIVVQFDSGRENYGKNDLLLLKSPRDLIRECINNAPYLHEDDLEELELITEFAAGYFEEKRKALMHAVYNPRIFDYVVEPLDARLEIARNNGFSR